MTVIFRLALMETALTAPALAVRETSRPALTLVMLIDEPAVVCTSLFEFNEVKAMASWAYTMALPEPAETLLPLMLSSLLMLAMPPAVKFAPVMLPAAEMNMSRVATMLPSTLRLLSYTSTYACKPEFKLPSVMELFSAASK